MTGQALRADGSFQYIQARSDPQGFQGLKKPENKMEMSTSRHLSW